LLNLWLIITPIFCFQSGYILHDDGKIGGVAILKMTEEEMYKSREQVVLSLSPELLKKGNWSETDLKEFSRRFTYDSYEDYLQTVQRHLEEIGVTDIKILDSSKDVSYQFVITSSFQAEINKSGGIGMMLSLTLFEGAELVLANANWKKVVKAIKKKQKTG
jgi:hypothetical protein